VRTHEPVETQKEAQVKWLNGPVVLFVDAFLIMVTLRWITEEFGECRHEAVSFVGDGKVVGGVEGVFGNECLFDGVESGPYVFRGGILVTFSVEKDAVETQLEMAEAEYSVDCFGFDGLWDDVGATVNVHDT
jgi:hypothetical protein